MKNIILFLFVLYLPMAGKAQINLALNPSFEEYSVCPDMIDEAKYSKHWMSLDTVWSPPDWSHAVYGIPEYINACSTYPDASVPYPGSKYPRSGNAMMQVQMFYDQFDTGIWTRDYLQGHLANVLSSGHKYSVTFFVTSEIISPYAINHIGAYLDDGSIDTTHYPGKIQTQYTPQIVDTGIVNDTLNWVKITDTFTANGSERFITIGNFYDRTHMHIIVVHDTTHSAYYGGFWAPYLVDDVSVIDCSNVPNAGHDTLITLGDSVFIGSHELLLPYKWYMSGSSTAIDSGGGFWAHPTAATTYVLEQNLCGIKKWDTVKVWVAPVGVSILQYAVSNLQIYPNPATGEITIEHAANCEMIFYDLTGRAILKSAITTDKQALDISVLPTGVYVVQIVDIVTGAKVVRKLLKE